MDFKYNGVDITTVAPVKIEDIRVSPIQYAPVVRPRAFQFGSDFVRMRGGERTVALTFALLDNVRTSRQNALFAMSEWAKTDAEYMIEIPDTTRVLFGVCTQKPDPSIRQWWENKLRFVFTCFENPYWTDKEETTVDCGVSVSVAGNAPPLMVIRNTFDEAAQNVEYSDGVRTMVFSEIPAGDMVIDLNRQTAAVDGVSIMGAFDPSGRFVEPATGSYMITGTGALSYRQRWE